MEVQKPFHFTIEYDGPISIVFLSGIVCAEARGDLLRLQYEIKEPRLEWVIFDFTALTDPSRSIFVEFFRIIHRLKHSNKRAFFVDPEGDIIACLANWGMIRAFEVFDSVEAAKLALAPKLLIASPIRLLLKSAA